MYSLPHNHEYNVLKNISFRESSYSIPSLISKHINEPKTEVSKLAKKPIHH